MATVKVKDGGVAKSISIVSVQDINAVVHTSGDETVAGVKTFTASPIVPTVADASDNSMKVASTAFVQNAISVSPDADNLLKKTSNGLKAAHRIIYLSSHSGTLSAEELAILKADKSALLEDGAHVYQRTGTFSSGTLRYNAAASVPAVPSDEYYLFTVEVNFETGAYLRLQSAPIVTKTVSDIPVTILTNPENVSGQCWYSVKNNMVTVGCNGLSATGKGFYNFTGFPSRYKPVQGQVCATVMALNTNPGNTALLYVDQVCVKFRPYEAGSDFYGSLSYMI